MAVEGTFPEVRSTQPAKELTTLTFEEEASVEYDFTPLTDDCREPTEDVEISSDDRASAERSPPACSQSRNPVGLSVPSRSSSREEATAGRALESKIRPPSKLTITIDRRARSMPASSTNSIANIKYIDPPAKTETVLGVDLSGDMPLASADKSESQPLRLSSKVTENHDDDMTTEHAHVKQIKPLQVHREVTSGVASPASPTPSGISSEHTLDQLYRSMLSQLNLEGAVEDNDEPACHVQTESGTVSKLAGSDMSAEQTLEDYNECHGAVSATNEQTTETKAETSSNRTSETGRSSAANVRSSSKRRARQLSGLGKHFAGSSKTTIADSTKAIASTTKSLAATSSKRLSTTSKTIGSKSKSLASKSKSVVANARARSKSRLRGFRTQRQEDQTSAGCSPVATPDENNEEQEVKSPGSNSKNEEGEDAEEYMPVDVAVEEIKDASADVCLEVMISAVEERNDETVKTITSRDLDEVNSTASASTTRLSSDTNSRAPSRTRAQQLSGLGKKLTGSSKSIASNSSRKISSTSKSIALSSKSAVANVRPGNRSTVRGSKAPSRKEEDSVEELSIEVKESPSVEAAGKKTNESSDANTDGAPFTSRATSRKRAQQLSGLGKKFTNSSRAIASNSTKRISTTTKSIAMSSRSAVAKVRVRSRSRVRGSKASPREEEKSVEVSSIELKESLLVEARVPSAETPSEQSEEEEIVEVSNEVMEESNKEIQESLSGTLLEENASMESKSNETAASTSDETESEDENKPTDNNQATCNFTEEEIVERDYSYSITPCDAVAEKMHIEESAPVSTSAADPILMPPPEAKFRTYGFMDGFRNFSRITEQFFSKTEEYWGDFATICGGEVSSASAMEANISMQEKGAVDPQIVSKTDELTLNSVEVSPIFDEQEPCIVENVSSVDDCSSQPTKDKGLPTEVEPILASLDPTPSIELGQSSSLRSTKSNKSLTLLTEVETKPSTESVKLTAPISKTLSMDPADSCSDSADIAGHGKSGSETRSHDEQLCLTSTEVINGITTSEIPVERRKSHGGLKDLKIRTSFLKKPSLGPKEDSTNGDEDGNEPHVHSVSVMRSLKTGLKHLSPRGNGGYKGFRRPKDQDSLDEGFNLSSTQKPIDHYDADGVRVYGGGITVPCNDKTQYPKHPLYYSRRKKKLGIRKHVNQMRETAQNMNKVLHKRIVAASQPRMKAIMTNHVYQKEPASK